MSWNSELVEQVSARPIVGYYDGGQPATEPIALTALSLVAHGEIEAADRGAKWLRNIQSKSGSVGIDAEHDRPGWPTSLAILAWHAVDGASQAITYQEATDRATQWLLDTKGEKLPHNDDVGHNTSLIGWPWVLGTHSWLEPTALAVIALKAAGYGTHGRVREAVKLLVNRELPRGGYNYGNTTVFGQELLSHVQPTALAVMALADEPTTSAALRSVGLLHQHWASIAGTASRCYAALALNAHGQLPEHDDDWLQSLYEKMVQPANRLALALLTLAAADNGFLLTSPGPDGATST